MMDKLSLKVDSNEMELVDFRIFNKGEEGIYEGIYGVNVAKVREIIRLPQLTELPGTPDFIDGIFDLRNVVIPVVNLAKWMGITSPPEIKKDLRVIIAEFNDILIGFIVHEAKRIRRINWKDIDPATFSSTTGSLDSGKITGVTKIEGDKVLLILDLESVIEDLGLYEPSTENKKRIVEKYSGTVLILDDSITARKILNNTLHEMGFEVVEANNGEEGLNALEKLYAQYEEDISDNLKLILSDIEMPRMDGFHFAAQVKKDGRFKEIPIIFNSSISSNFAELRSKEIGAEACLVKFQDDEFHKEVSRVIREHIK